MSIDPLKIPAFMRKASLKKGNSTNRYYKASEATQIELPAVPARPKRQKKSLNQPPVFQTPFMSASMVPAKPKRQRRKAVQPMMFQEPMFEEQSFTPTPQPQPFYQAPMPTLAPTLSAMMPVGVVTAYLDKINVVIVKLGAEIRVGSHLMLNGENGPYRQKLKSMQINRQNVETAGRGDEVGIKVSKKAIVGEMVYVVE